MHDNVNDFKKSKMLDYFQNFQKLNPSKIFRCMVVIIHLHLGYKPLTNMYKYFARKCTVEAAYNLSV